MSTTGLGMTVQLLRAGSGITSLVGNRIYPVAVPQSAAYPNIAVHMIHSDEETLLQGASQWFASRISIECRGSSTNGDPVQDADRLAEAVIDWLRDKTRYQILDVELEVTKEGTDETDKSDSVDARGIPDVVRRIVDFYIRWRRISP